MTLHSAFLLRHQSVMLTCGVTYLLKLMVISLPFTDAWYNLGYANAYSWYRVTQCKSVQWTSHDKLGEDYRQTENGFSTANKVLWLFLSGYTGFVFCFFFIIFIALIVEMKHLTYTHKYNYFFYHGLSKIKLTKKA